MISTLFWLCVGAIIYTYFGYPLLITFLAKVYQRPVKIGPITPSITLFIPAYNEEEIIAEKISNSLSLDYPPEQLKIMVIADGSDDNTVSICQGFPEIKVYCEPERRGKIAAINRGMEFVDSEIVVFSDANTMLDSGTLLAMARNFADPKIASVAGEKQVLGGGEGLYWRYESHLKLCDSTVGNVIGAAGELFATRTKLFVPSNSNLLLDDFIMSMRLVVDGWRVVYEPEAIAREAPSESLSADWERRTRNAAGGYQSIPHLIGILNPARGLVAWQYFSHKLMRWITPFLLPVTLLLNLFLWQNGFYLLTLIGQVMFYLLAGLGYLFNRRGKESGILYTIFFFCLTNFAAIAGFWRLITNNQPVTWQKVR